MDFFFFFLDLYPPETGCACNPPFWSVIPGNSAPYGRSLCAHGPHAQSVYRGFCAQQPLARSTSRGICATQLLHKFPSWLTGQGGRVCTQNKNPGRLTGLHPSGGGGVDKGAGVCYHRLFQTYGRSVDPSPLRAPPPPHIRLVPCPQETICQTKACLMTTQHCLTLSIFHPNQPPVGMEECLPKG